MNIRLSLSLFLMVFASLAMASKLESLVVKVEKNKTTVMCAFVGNSAHKVFTLTKPDRVVIDFDNATTALDVGKVKLGNSLIAFVRSGHPRQETLRLVFDLKQAVTIKTTSQILAKSGQKGLRIELLQKNVNNPQKMSPISVKGLKTINSQHRAVQVRHSPPRGMRDVIVVLDPGHGGKDPGASGPRRSLEKQVVLTIAIKLKQLIDRQPGMRAVLTRDGDYYVGLRKRLDIARKYNADIFVSIHADAFVNKHSNGASVFALSPTGATSEAARWLAEKENYSELGGVDLSGLDDQNGVIRTVLIDLSQTATIGSSLQMGSRVLQNLDKITSLHNNKVEQARFVVLKSPDIPSILIETGFITNPYEERNLTNAQYQAKLTQAIFTGVKRYFWDYPPQGTRVEAMSNVNRRLVRFDEATKPRTFSKPKKVTTANRHSTVHKNLSKAASWG